MNIATIIGLIMAFGGVIWGYLMEGGHLSALLLLPPALIVFGGSFGATALAFNPKQMASMPRLLLQVFKTPPFRIAKFSEMFVEMAGMAKKQGLLSLEGYMNNHKDLDALIKHGITMILDGADSDRLRVSMEEHAELEETRKHLDISVYEAIGGFAPTMGVLGTVMGLVHTLSDMGSPEKLTKAISGAFIATLYGVGIANLLFLPIASKLKSNLKLYMLERQYIIEAITAIQRGESVRNIGELADPYLTMMGGKKKAGKGGE